MLIIQNTRADLRLCGWTTQLTTDILKNRAKNNRESFIFSESISLSVNDSKASVPERLLIIEKDSGLCLFDHKWVESDVDEDFFGGVLQGFLHISTEAFRKGDIREIRFEGGILLIHHGQSIMAGLLTTGDSKKLKSELADFVQMFESDYYSNPYSSPNEVSKYEIVSTLVGQFFPEYPKVSAATEIGEKDKEFALKELNELF